jgi:putative ABC transport system substrate-binding protein
MEGGMRGHGRRRLLEGGLALAGLGLLAGCERSGEQSPKVRRIGFLAVGSREGRAFLMIADLALKYRLPTMTDFRELPESGGLLSFGPDLVDSYRRAATHVNKILKGANPADLPIEQPTKFDLYVNLKTARALGLTIPQSVMVQATRVIP